MYSQRNMRAITCRVRRLMLVCTGEPDALKCADRCEKRKIENKTLASYRTVLKVASPVGGQGVLGGVPSSARGRKHFIRSEAQPES